ncbi:bifunctional biotin--[acetyl-CoA-carboxylase] ligase/biotin operon repressor BirA [Neptunicella sp. SCSIO 80796]|uniref:bifunctional biotin--[acetyl-CoA-carboxylase] ligase/biotin operon repressor BirA n=1 Tax=Neptunicella plasticusilytica TaxID=3117012 RepID=UPI003A4DA0F6
MTVQGEHKRSEILAILVDGQFHSGQTLGELLGISRVSVSKHIKVLGELGLDIFSIAGKGYKLSQPVTLLSQQKIQQSIQSCAVVEVLSVVGSTNDVIKSKTFKLQNGFTCLAEAQTAGRGRQGKRWISPFGASLYLSMYWNFPAGYHSVNGLSLVVGLAVANGLERFGVSQAKLKWPNDIYVNDQKLAGILVELEGQVGSDCHAIIGVGLNINIVDSKAQIGQAWTDMNKITGNTPDRNKLSAVIVDELVSAVEEFERKGFESFIQRWCNKDWLMNRPAKLHCGSSIIKGIGKGVDHQGALLLETAQGIQRFYGGEISVRAE